MGGRGAFEKSGQNGINQELREYSVIGYIDEVILTRLIQCIIHIRRSMTGLNECVFIRTIVLFGQSI